MQPHNHPYELPASTNACTIPKLKLLLKEIQLYSLSLELIVKVPVDHSVNTYLNNFRSKTAYPIQLSYNEEKSQS